MIPYTFFFFFALEPIAKTKKGAKLFVWEVCEGTHVQQMCLLMGGKEQNLGLWCKSFLWPLWVMFVNQQELQSTQQSDPKCQELG